MQDIGETYLGDGLYASFDGYQIQLRAPQFDGNDDNVFLEPAVLDRFMAYLRALTDAARKADANEA